LAEVLTAETPSFLSYSFLLDADITLAVRQPRKPRNVLAAPRVSARVAGFKNLEAIAATCLGYLGELRF
jgi:hypothetical protein